MRSLLILLLVSALTAVPGEAANKNKKEIKQLQADLLGHSMGGREKCWAFQTPKQIQRLVIDDRRDVGNLRLYDVSLTLSDQRCGDVFDAKARLTYEKVRSRWELRTVGLLSLERAR